MSYVVDWLLDWLVIWLVSWLIEYLFQDLEQELAQARSQKNVFEESSMLAFEDMEEKEKIIHDQECVSCKRVLCIYKL